MDPAISPQIKAWITQNLLMQELRRIKTTDSASSYSYSDNTTSSDVAESSEDPTNANEHTLRATLSLKGYLRARLVQFKLKLIDTIRPTRSKSSRLCSNGA
jgi:hypothetical protein